MKTIFEKIESVDELPENVITNTTRPNLFGCLYKNPDTKEIKVDRGILEEDKKINIFKEQLDNGFIHLMNYETIDYTFPYGKHVFERKADVTVYYLNNKV